MKFSLWLCLIVAYFANTHCYIEKQHRRRAKPNPGSCASVNPEVGTMQKDEVKEIGGFVQAVCVQGGKISFFGCGEIEEELQCKVKEGNPTKPYSHIQC